MLIPVRQASQQAEDSDAAAIASASRAAPHDLADQVRGANAAPSRPSESDDAQPSAALPATAQQSQRGAASSTAAEAANPASPHAQERAVADGAHRLASSVTASMHAEHMIQSDVAGEFFEQCQVFVDMHN